MCLYPIPWQIMLKRVFQRLFQAPPRPLGRWCNVGDHPLRRPAEWKEDNKRRRAELQKNGTDPYERLRKDEVVVHELVEW